MLVPTLSQRDTFLIFVGAVCMYICAIILFHSLSLAHVGQGVKFNQVEQLSEMHVTAITHTGTQNTQSTEATPVNPASVIPTGSLPPSRLVAHAPGWTILHNLYMHNGTLYILLPTHQVIQPPPPSTPDNTHPEYIGHADWGVWAGQDLSYGYTSAQGWPMIRRMTSSGKEAGPMIGNEAEREPSVLDMRFLKMEDAEARWGRKASVLLLFNDLPQFLRHYYHLVAELFLGVQSFWSSAFSRPDNRNLQVHFERSMSLTLHRNRSGSSASTSQTPTIHRAIFVRSHAHGWRNDPGFNAYFLRSAFPWMSVEHVEDWRDRVVVTVEGGEDCVHRFPLVLLADRSAAHRGLLCGAKTQRTAAEAWDYMRRVGRLRGVVTAGWWAPVRKTVWRSAGVRMIENSTDGQSLAVRVSRGEAVKSILDEMSSRVENMEQGFVRLAEAQNISALEAEGVLLEPEMDELGDTERVLNVKASYQGLLDLQDEVVVTYISRQGGKARKLVQGDHEGLVRALEELVIRKNSEREDVLNKGADTNNLDDSDTPLPPPWSLQVISAEHLSKPAQIRAAALTTFMVGVHGNGLTHLVWMKPSRWATVIEMFCEGGFAHDYQWTAGSLGIGYVGVWEGGVFGGGVGGGVEYPECFQGDRIRVRGDVVVRAIEDRVRGAL
ncbi:hypothetical protein FA15DRAFT_683683 [Coprinopsis marcescibilis]|uniref:Uncharacterized protein n=1 Tax=Coprinopsis marcescibilis TaxID=230819 RepID=A0A5C3K9Z7_COPMA|nr:hypothetical protein FA15DRAFT_683683 [Coprinopsis marcescibilis]